MSDEYRILSIVDRNRVLHVELVGATEMAFDVPIADHAYDRLIADICGIAPVLMRYDMDMTEAYDDAFRTKPKTGDRKVIEAFRRKYHVTNTQGCFFD